jgi:hypothetical protein
MLDRCRHKLNSHNCQLESCKGDERRKCRRFEHNISQHLRDMGVNIKLILVGYMNTLPQVLRYACLS